MSRAVNKHLSVVKKRFGRFSVLIGFGRTLVLILIVRKKVNTFDLYYIKFHTQRFVYRSWPDLIRHCNILYTAADRQSITCVHSTAQEQPSRRLQQDQKLSAT